MDDERTDLAHRPRRIALQRRSPRSSTRDYHRDGGTPYAPDPVRLDDGVASIPLQGQRRREVVVVSPERFHDKLSEKKKPHLLPHYAAVICAMLLLSFLLDQGQF